MSVTRLKRKHRKNIARANNKQHVIKELLRTPVLKNVDLEELKARFPAASLSAAGVAGAVAAVQETAATAVANVQEAAAHVAQSELVAQAKEAAGAAVEQVEAVAALVAESDVVEKVKEAATAVVDQVSAVAETIAHTTSDVFAQAKEVVGDVVDQVKAAVSGPAETVTLPAADEPANNATAADTTDETADNAATFEDAEAVTKPVNTDGQGGEHPKPEIAL